MATADTEEKTTFVPGSDSDDDDCFVEQAPTTLKDAPQVTQYTNEVFYYCNGPGKQQYQGTIEEMWKAYNESGEVVGGTKFWTEGMNGWERIGTGWDGAIDTLGEDAAPPPVLHDGTKVYWSQPTGMQGDCPLGQLKVWYAQRQFGAHDSVYVNPVITPGGWTQLFNAPQLFQLMPVPIGPRPMLHPGAGPAVLRQPVVAYKWQWNTGTHNKMKWTDYESGLSQAIEQIYGTKQTTIHNQAPNGQTYSIDWKQLKQSNVADTERWRYVRRIVDANPGIGHLQQGSPSDDAQAPLPPPATQPPPPTPPTPSPTNQPFDPKKGYIHGQPDPNDTAWQFLLDPQNDRWSMYDPTSTRMIEKNYQDFQNKTGTGKFTLKIPVTYLPVDVSFDITDPNHKWKRATWTQDTGGGKKRKVRRVPMKPIIWMPGPMPQCVPGGYKGGIQAWQGNQTKRSGCPIHKFEARILYHCTTEIVCKIVMKTGKLIRGWNSEGMLGAGVYFAKTPYQAAWKAEFPQKGGRNNFTKCYVLKVLVNVGKRLDLPYTIGPIDKTVYPKTYVTGNRWSKPIEDWNKTNVKPRFKSLYSGQITGEATGYDSVFARYGGGKGEEEYVIFNWDQMIPIDYIKYEMAPWPSNTPQKQKCPQAEWFLRYDSKPYNGCSSIYDATNKKFK